MIRFYKKPFVTAAILLILGMAMFAAGLYFADIQNDSNYYALAVFGSLLCVSALISFAVYGSLEKKFRSVIYNQTLIDFIVSEEVFSRVAAKTMQNIKSNNKSALIIMLFFCGVLAVFGPFIAEDGYIISLISICVGIFFSIAASVITKFRSNKISSGSRRVVLSKNGAYVCGEYYSWVGTGVKLSGVSYATDHTEYGEFTYLKIEYTALTLPSPTAYTVIVPIPKKDDENIMNELVRNINEYSEVH